MAAAELEFADDEIAPALSFERLKALALEHLGGSPDRDDVAVFNRLTGATIVRLAHDKGALVYVDDAGGIPLQFRLSVTLGDGREVGTETVAAVNKLLEAVSTDLRLTN